MSATLQSTLPRKRSLNEFQPASVQPSVSRQFLDRVWCELEDIHSYGFSNAVLSCEHFLGAHDIGKENIEQVEAKFLASSDETSSCSDSELESNAGSDDTSSIALGEFATSDSDSSATSETRSNSSRSSKLVHEPSDVRETAQSSESISNATSRKSLQTSANANLPCIKGRPVGVTGFRLIHMHTFRMRNGKFHHGFNLKFPDRFGLKTSKAKDLMNLVDKRNRMLETWALQNTHLSKGEIADWIAGIDRVKR